MTDLISISQDSIIAQIKLSRKIPEIVKEIVINEIILTAVTREKIKIDPLEVQEAADNFRIQKQLLNTQDTLLWFNNHGLSLDDFEAMIYRNLLFSKLAQHLFPTEKIESFFHEHHLDFTQVIIYEIVLDNLDLATELYYAISQKEVSFWEVAHKYIKDTELRRKGGYQGILKRKDLKPELSAAIFSTNPPQLLKPILIDKKAYLLLVEEIIHPQLTKQLHYEIASNLFNTWLEQKIKDYQTKLILDS